MTKEKARLAVMGAISMALKDPTLQQGFEIICKENAELEAQIEKMKSCENCKNNYFLCSEEPCYSCTRCYARTIKKTTDKWELAE